jgi:hypothetical protein
MQAQRWNRTQHPGKISIAVLQKGRNDWYREKIYNETGGIFQ